MNLQELLRNIITETPVINVKGLSSDSRKVEPGDLFFAINGNKLKGADFANQAVEKGAVAIISDDKIEGLDIPCFHVEDIRQVVSLVASRFYYKQPENIIAVTGTNGKTSTAMFAMQMFDVLGEKSASIGTLGVMDKTGLIIPTDVTTPDAIEIHKILNHLSEEEYTSATFEASSHGLDQYRIDNVKIKTAGFTNLTRDHLEYHKTMVSYGNSKKRLFTEILPSDGTAVLNADDEFFDEIKDCGRDVISYGYNGKSLRLISSTILPTGQLIRLLAFGQEYDIVLGFDGEFQIMNALCAAGMLIGCGFDKDKVIASIGSLHAPAGRLELAGTLKNDARVYIDYAHTPDALENVLKSLRPFTNAKLKVLFGCGGDRDAGKRPLMGEVAEKYADIVYITDDNPRSEEPESIRAEILKGMNNKGQNAGDRASAIEMAIKNLGKDDILLIAGKGHEDYQEVKGIKHPFDDKKLAMEIIANL